MTTDSTPFEEAARIVEAMSGGMSETASVEMAGIAKAVRESERLGGTWDDAAMVVARYQKIVSFEVLSVMPEVTKAIRDRTVDS
ncbi:hypothetical protein ACFOD4_04540 [Pseudoroseomonas globiformis]|uniref:Uncharacterized protein n=1 Tax=Teichococcus globiformis TaxID=2307229 RepID=A0ABV7FVV7_9PROT